MTGEIDVATADELRADLLAVVLTALPHRLDVDLADVTLLTAQGLSVLLFARQVTADAGPEVPVGFPAVVPYRPGRGG